MRETRYARFSLRAHGAHRGHRKRAASRVEIITAKTRTTALPTASTRRAACPTSFATMAWAWRNPRSSVSTSIVSTASPHSSSTVGRRAAWRVWRAAISDGLSVWLRELYRPPNERSPW